MTAERFTYGQYSGFIVRDCRCHGNHHLNFRDVIALVAARDGLVKARERRRQCYGLVDYSIVAECDLFGIGPHTLSALQDRWGLTALLTKPEKPGPVRLTRHGRAVLDAVLRLPGVHAERIVHG